MFLPTRGCELRSLAFFPFFFFLIMFSSCYQARALSAKVCGGAKWIICTITDDTVDIKQYVNVLLYQKSPKKGTG